LSRVHAASGQGQANADLAGPRAAVADAARRLAREGLVAGTSGNVSARAGELVAITPTGIQLEHVASSEVTCVALDGSVVEGVFVPSSELDLHLGIYARYGPGAVVHTHSPFATALACVLDGELPCIHYEMLELGGPVRVAPYRTFGTPDLAAVTIEALHDRSAVLMSNHGAVVTGDDAAHAVRRALLLEWACTLYWRACAVGVPRTLDAQQLDAVAAATAARGYGATKRLDT
jgi:L-fuculose-phosphate aldolase